LFFLLQFLIQVDGTIAVLALPAWNAEAVTMCADTILQASSRALDFDLAATTHKARATEALAKATQTTFGASQRASILYSVGTILAGATFDAEAPAHVANTSICAVLGALLGTLRTLLACLALKVGIASTLALDAHTVTGARQRCAFAGKIFRAVRTLEAGEATALASLADTLALDTACGTDFEFLTVLSVVPRVAEALGKHTKTSTLTGLLGVGGVHTLASGSDHVASRTSVARSTKASPILTNTLAVAVVRASRVLGEFFANFAFKASVAKAFAVHADTMSRAAILAGTLALAVGPFITGVAVAAIILANTVLMAATVALATFGAFDSCPAGRAMAFTLWLEAHTSLGIHTTLTVHGVKPRAR